MKKYALLTPYYIPKEMECKKRVNIGDGFVLRRVIERLGWDNIEFIFSTRKELQQSEIKKINSVDALVIAGTNQLTDNFSIAGDMPLSKIVNIKVPIVPFGIGVSGAHSRNTNMSKESAEIIKYIHSGIKYSSWRCVETIEYLRRNVEGIEMKTLLTGCPVVYAGPLCNGKSFSESYRNIVVTITDRGKFFDRELDLIKSVSEKFPSSNKILSLHQFYPGRPIRHAADCLMPRRWKCIGKRISLREIDYSYKCSKLMWIAQKLGYTIFCSENDDDYMKLYNNSDAHIGSRLHAHLYFLSQAKPSWIIPVDGRARAFQKTLKFPMVARVDENLLEYNGFEEYRRNVELLHKNMQVFVSWLNGD